VFFVLNAANNQQSRLHLHCYGSVAGRDVVALHSPDWKRFGLSAEATGKSSAGDPGTLL